MNEKKKKRGLKNDGEECRLDFVELVGPLEEEEEDKEKGEHQQARDAVGLYERGCCRSGARWEDCTVWRVRGGRAEMVVMVMVVAFGRGGVWRGVWG